MRTVVETLWAWLRGSRLPQLKGEGDFSFPIAGEGEFQSALERIVGGKREESCEKYVKARLVPEPTEHDPNAVSIEIKGRKVGYLAAPIAPKYLEQMAAFGLSGPAQCKAVIVGGWRRPGGDEGSFGVRLD